MTRTDAPTLLPGREVPLGGVRGMSVQRWLPHRALPDGSGPAPGPCCTWGRVAPRCA